MVAEAGIEPALPKEQDFESSASTSSATQPNCTLVGWRLPTCAISRRGL
mgnify:CR=1 FL=1